MKNISRLALAFLVAVSTAHAGRLTTFAWDNGANWPEGTTVELCGNGDVCAAGITGNQHTLDLPVNPGDVISGKVRAYKQGYQCGDPLVLCEYSDWATVATTWPKMPDNFIVAAEEMTMADPTFAALGTLIYRGSAPSSSLSSTITNVAVGDLIVVIVQRDYQHLCTGVASSSPALTFTKVRTVTSEGTGLEFNTDLWAAIATTAAASMTITASYSDSQAWGSMFSARYSGGVSSITPNASTAHTALQTSSTNRTNANMTTTRRTLMVAFGTNWDFYYLISAAANWNLRVNSDTFGDNTTTQFLLDRIAGPGTYPSGNYGTNATADQYMSGIAAFPLWESTPPQITKPYSRSTPILVR